MPILIALIPTLVSTLVPVLLSAFTKANPSASQPDAHAWVLGLFQDVGTALKPHVPDWLMGELGPIEQALATIAQVELSKLIP